MNTSSKIPTILNWTIFLAGLAILILDLIGQAEFGHGLGDLVYLILIGVFVLTHLILNWTFAKPKRKERSWSVGVVFLLFYLFFAYKMTYGRGPEKPWYPKIENGKNEDVLEMFDYNNLFKSFAEWLVLI